MVEIKLVLNDKKQGAFHLYEDGKREGEMVIAIDGENLIVYHTEVNPEAEGKGYGKQLFLHLVNYVREHQLKVTPLCPFVHAQFKRHPDEYAAIWNKQEE